MRHLQRLRGLAQVDEALLLGLLLRRAPLALGVDLFVVGLFNRALLLGGLFVLFNRALLQRAARRSRSALTCSWRRRRRRRRRRSRRALRKGSSVRRALQ